MISKFLALILSPIFISIMLLAIGAIKGNKIVTFFTLTCLVIASTPFFASVTSRAIEIPHYPRQLSPEVHFDYVVVLSGAILRLRTSDGDTVYEFGEEVDRYLTGVEMYRRGLTEYLVFTGGMQPWHQGLPEGEVLKNLAISDGVEPDRIIVTDGVRNTLQEAEAISMIVNADDRVGLVTSAFHMERAIMSFEQYGVTTIPIPVDFRSATNKLTIFDFLPSADALKTTSLTFKELLGRMYLYVFGI